MKSCVFVTAVRSSLALTFLFGLVSGMLEQHQKYLFYASREKEIKDKFSATRKIQTHHTTRKKTQKSAKSLSGCLIRARSRFFVVIYRRNI